MRKIYLLNLFIAVIGFFESSAQGTWTQLVNIAPHKNISCMLLLSDGTVIAHTRSGGTDNQGTIWDRLTPDATGSYVNGTWTSIAPMNYSRVYFSSQVLKDGRVYAAGGEYGTGGSEAEIYDPIKNTWTVLPYSSGVISDANSEILPDGRVLQALVNGTLTHTDIYNPVTNVFSAGPTCLGIHNESAWVKLPDSSILFVNRPTALSNPAPVITPSERYIPSQNKWIADAMPPVGLYDQYGNEDGPATLLPNGKVFFIGSAPTTAIYTPSGNTSPGTWVAGPNVPGMGAPDAPSAMMVSGTILCVLSPTPTASSEWPTPTTFYEYDYVNNTFSQVSYPTGGPSNAETEWFGMLDLPNGQILLSYESSSVYWVYTPSGAPLAAGKPTISKIINNNCDTLTAIGTLFNGITEGAEWGDDVQNATNYPVIRLTDGTKVYYARTFNWNSTGVMRGSNPDTTQFTLPAGIPNGTYSLVVTANGNPSDPVSFTTPCTATGISETGNINYNTMFVYPNPANEQVTISFKANDEENYIIKMLDVLGRTIKEETGEAVSGDNTRLITLNGISKGIYMISLQKGDDIFKTTKIVVE